MPLGRKKLENSACTNRTNPYKAAKCILVAASENRHSSRRSVLMRIRTFQRSERPLLVHLKLPMRLPPPPPGPAAALPRLDMYQAPGLSPQIHFTHTDSGRSGRPGLCIARHKRPAAMKPVTTLLLSSRIASAARKGVPVSFVTSAVPARPQAGRNPVSVSYFPATKPKVVL